MKIVNEKGKLFGIINVVDLVILLGGRRSRWRYYLAGVW